ncbi:LysR family transcriptional regulator ArgP [Nitratireductor sp. GCM10026969]|uniref:LysR family transcriptional regulator ArgP n=1 Tax=Nitratireductor sp. GCM10026969 TaxID=3252645 RepID=UPI003620588A
MMDYPALRAVAAVVQTGSFEKAARVLNVTPSAVSQRIKQLEERLGVVLVVRGNPCVATAKGELLCRHIEHVGMLESELYKSLPALAGQETPQKVTIHVATNADSLGTWFLKAAARFSRQSAYLLNIAVDDQDHTAEWLQRGRVLAAVTSLDRPVAGCRRVFLGALRYHATASPDFFARYFAQGVTPESLAHAPALTFCQKDRLQAQWVGQAFGEELSHPTHWLPSTQAFVEACQAGMGWGLNPAQLVKDDLNSGRLVELIPGLGLDVRLYWQVNRLAADRLEGLTKEIVTTARRDLVHEAPREDE